VDVPSENLQKIDVYQILVRDRNLKKNSLRGLRCRNLRYLDILN